MISHALFRCLATIALVFHGATALAPAQAPAQPTPTEAQIDAAAAEIEDQLVPMGIDLQNLLNAGSPRGFEKLFSRERFAYQIMQGINYGESLPPDLGKLLGEAANMGILFFDWKDGARFRFLRIRAVDGRLGLFMRCVHSNGNVSYFTFLLGPGQDNQGLRVVDVYVHRAAHYRSTLARRHLAYAGVMMGALKPGQLNLGLSWPDIQKVNEINMALGSGNLDAVAGLYGQMSKQGQDEPAVILMNMAASLKDPAAFQAGLAKMNQVAPEEIAQDLMLSDKLMDDGKWTEAIAAFQKLDEKLGGDAYITLRIARCHYEKASAAEGEEATAERKKAGEIAVKAIKQEPDLHAAYMLLLDLEVDKGNFEGAFKMLKLLADKFNLVITPDQFAKSPEYADFMKSPAFTKWQDYAKTKTAELAGTPAKTP